MKLARIIGGILFIIVLHPPTDARVRPYSLSNSGLFSASHYYIRESTSTIRVLTLDGLTQIRVNTPESNLCNPMMQPDDPDHVFFAGGPRTSSWEWTIYSANLGSGSVCLAFPNPFECYPLDIEPLGTRFGFLIYGGDTGLKLLPPGATDIIVIQRHGVRAPAFDPDHEEIRWCESPAFECDSDVLQMFRQVTLCRYDLRTGETTRTRFKVGHLWSPAFWIGDSLRLGSQVLFEVGQVNLLTQKDTSHLYSLNLKQGDISEIHECPVDSLRCWEGRWGIVEEHSENPSGQYTLCEFPSFEVKAKIHEKVQQMIQGESGNPIILTDDSILVFDTTGKVIEKRYKVSEPQK